MQNKHAKINRQTKARGKSQVKVAKAQTGMNSAVRTKATTQTTKKRKTKFYLTEKKMANRRFADTEKRILEAFIKNPETDVAHLTKRARISRPTFYRHHRSIFGIVSDHKKYMRLKFRRRLHFLMRRKNLTLRHAYQEALFFILSNKSAFQALMSWDGVESLEWLLYELRPKFERFARLSKNTRKIYRIYSGEVMMVLAEWSEEDFAECKVAMVLDDIMKLGSDARNRLMPLVHE